MFFHLVRIGTHGVSISELLQEWSNFKETGEYKKLKERSAQKSPMEIELKSKRDRLRYAVLKSRQQKAPEEVQSRLKEELTEAQAAYAATGRSGRSSGVAHHFT